MKVKSFSRTCEPKGEVEAPGIFSRPASVHVIHLAMLRELANARAGTHSVKTRSQVSGGGKKPWRQKHTGRARQGSIRAPQWRGGGIVFGPQPRKYSQDMPVTARRAALRGLLADRIRTGHAVVLEDVGLEEPKTKHALGMIKKLELDGTSILVLPAKAPEVSRAFRNLAGTSVAGAQSVSLYDLVRHRNVVLVGDSLKILAGRCGEEQV